MRDGEWGGLPAGTLPALALGAAAVLALAATTTAAAFTGGLAATAAIAGYAAIALLIARSITHSHAAPVFGWPNLVTLLRAVATMLVAGYAVEVLVNGPPADGIARFFALLAAAAIAADGIDGWLARRRGPATAFGARFDMETDAFLLLALSVVALGAGKAGLWVILIGAMRYGFVAASWHWRWIDAPLPPSFRRKAVCVVQGAALTALALPEIVPPVSTALAAVALAALVWSFAVDILWLHRNRGA